MSRRLSLLVAVLVSPFQTSWLPVASLLFGFGLVSQNPVVDLLVDGVFFHGFPQEQDPYGDPLLERLDVVVLLYLQIFLMGALVYVAARGLRYGTGLAAASLLGGGAILIASGVVNLIGLVIAILRSASRYHNAQLGQEVAGTIPRPDLFGIHEPNEAWAIITSGSLGLWESGPLILGAAYLPIGMTTFSAAYLVWSRKVRVNRSATREKRWSAGVLALSGLLPLLLLGMVRGAYLAGGSVVTVPTDSLKEVLLVETIPISVWPLSPSSEVAALPRSSILLSYSSEHWRWDTIGAATFLITAWLALWLTLSGMSAMASRVSIIMACWGAVIVASLVATVAVTLLRALGSAPSLPVFVGGTAPEDPVFFAAHILPQYMGFGVLWGWMSAVPISPAWRLLGTMQAIFFRLPHRRKSKSEPSLDDSR